MAERWKHVVERPIYEVSDLGRVRSPNGIMRTGLLNGYPSLVLKFGVPVTRYVHRLVLEAFVGPCAPGHECAHWDGNRANPRLANLRWTTRKDNHADKRRHGTLLRGEKSGLPRFTARKVKEVRRLLRAGKKQRDIAARFGVLQGHISQIKRKVIWGWLP